MASKIPYFRSFPIDFQKEVVGEIKKFIEIGSNMQLVGTRGSGKSLFFRMLTVNPERVGDVRVFYYDLLLDTLFDEGTDALKKGRKCLFLLDSFDEIKNELLIKKLASLYDNYRDFLTIIFSVNRPIDTFDKFFGEAYYLQGLNEKDAKWFIEGIESSYGKKISSKSINLIVDETGGHMGLIKRLIEAKFSGKSFKNLLNNPALDPHLNYQLEVIKEELSGRKNYFTSPLIERFLDDKKIIKKIRLTNLENKVYEFLRKNPNSVINRKDTIEEVWGENGLNISDHALDQIIYRLNLKLSKMGRGERIETVRGRGHELVN